MPESGNIVNLAQNTHIRIVSTLHCLEENTTLLGSIVEILQEML